MELPNELPISDKNNVWFCHQNNPQHRKRLLANNSNGLVINCLSFVTDYKLMGTVLELMKAKSLYFKGSH